MRAPGEAPGVYALECAINEFAHQVDMDPLEFRLRNYADIDQNENKPWSSKKLREWKS
jgi:xanthine dehydrogenase YagR molybdenum-binding subunit